MPTSVELKNTPSLKSPQGIIANPIKYKAKKFASKNFTVQN
jgi:hypothetical protein